jgi:hypothetical protein
MKPKLGDDIEMSVMDDDLGRKVQFVGETQPYAEPGVFNVLDQFGEHHLVEYDGLVWATVNPFAIIEAW